MKKFQTPEDVRIEKLEGALDAILNGTPMDDCGNHNDDGLVDMSHGRGPTKANIHQWIQITKTALKKF